MRNIVEWILQTYVFEGGDSIEGFYWSYLAYQTRALLNGKFFAEGDGIYSVNEDLIAGQVQLLINKTFLHSDQFWEHWKLYEEVETFAWPPHKNFVVRAKDPKESTAPGMCISCVKTRSKCFISLQLISHGRIMDSLGMMRSGSQDKEKSLKSASYYM